MELTKAQIIKAYLDLGIHLEKFPSQKEFSKEEAIGAKMVAEKFGCLGGLKEEAAKKAPSKFAKLSDLHLKSPLAKKLLKVTKQRKREVGEEEFLSFVRMEEVPAHFSDFEDLRQYALSRYPEMGEVESAYTKKKLRIAKIYADTAKNLRHLPSRKDLRKEGLTRDIVRHHFMDYESLEEFARESYPEDFKRVFAFGDLYNDERYKKIKKDIKKHNRFFISTVGTGMADTRALEAAMSFCELNNALLLLIPAKQDLQKIDPAILDLHEEGRLHIVFDDVDICKHLRVSAMEIDEKVVNPSGGLQRYEPEYSFIYPSPKQTFKPVPVKKGRLPRIIYSPGAITHASYHSHIYRRSKRCLLAEQDHMMGGLIVERSNKGLFFPFQVQFSQDGSFPFWGIQYNPDGTVHANLPETMVLGDLHSKTKAVKVFQKTLEIAGELGVERAVLHDIFDAKSVNPHERGKLIHEIVLELEDHATLSEELQVLVDDIKQILGVFKQVHIVDSNHDDMLQRAFDSGQIEENKKNAFLARLLGPYAVMNSLRGKFKSKKELVKRIVEKTGIQESVLNQTYPELFSEKKTLQFACELFGLPCDKKLVHWLDIEESLVKGGFELGDHGHKGANGARGSLAGSQRSFKKKIEGHSHTPEQFNFLFRVGHLHEMEPTPDYAKGGTSGWIHTHALTYSTGQACLVSIIEGEYRCEKGAVKLSSVLKKTKRKGQKIKIKKARA